MSELIKLPGFLGASLMTEVTVSLSFTQELILTI